MHEFIKSRKCDDLNYIDVYNITESLSLNHREQAEKMSYDQVHWGFEINLWKAQIVLNALISGKDQ